MPTYEGLRLKILEYNCWGGMLYESFNLPKETPTVGSFIMAKDYINFLSNLKEYIDTPLTFINPQDSKWLKQVSQDKRYGTYPVGKINDIEIFFLHYRSQKEVLDKWNQRIKRINWNNLLIKFNDQNGCTEEDVKEFFKLPFKNKIFFTCKNWPGQENNPNCIVIKQFPKHDVIMASYEPFGRNKYVDLNKLINNL